MRGQLGKADCSIDVITQSFFAECHLAREKAFDSIAQKPFAEGGVALHACLNCCLKSRVKAMFIPLLFLSVASFSACCLPSSECKIDVVLLALFRSAAKKDDYQLAFFPKIHSITWVKINLALVMCSLC